MWYQVHHRVKMSWKAQHYGKSITYITSVLVNKMGWDNFLLLRASVMLWLIDSIQWNSLFCQWWCARAWYCLAYQYRQLQSIKWEVFKIILPFYTFRCRFWVILHYVFKREHFTSEVYVVSKLYTQFISALTIKYCMQYAQNMLTKKGRKISQFLYLIQWIPLSDPVLKRGSLSC